MLGFVLFLLSVLLIIIIIKLLPRKVYKWIGLAILIVLGLFAATVGYFLYQEYQSNQRREASHKREMQELEIFLRDIDTWGIENAKKNSGRYSINRDEIRQYANDLYQARNYSFRYSAPDYFHDNQINKTLDTPIDGIREIKVICDSRFLGADCMEAVQQGYRGGFLLKIYSLDMKKIYSPIYGWKSVSSVD